MRVLIIGTGYVGLNTGVMLAYLGNEVTCIDLNQEKVKRLQAGEVTIFEPHLDELFAEVHQRCILSAITLKRTSPTKM